MYKRQLLEFPLGLFGIAISTVILPTLARHHVNREDNSSQSAVDFRNTMDWGVRMILLLGVPAAIDVYKRQLLAHTNDVVRILSVFFVGI